VSLCFLHGAGLPDPAGLLRGSGNVVRSLPLASAATLELPAVKALMNAALARAGTRLSSQGGHALVIKSVSAKQRPRQKPAPAAKR